MPASPHAAAIPSPELEEAAMRATRATVALLALLLATAAVAGVTELIDRAEALLDDYQALEVEIDDCPGGECPEAQQLVDDLDALDAELVTLHFDVTALPVQQPHARRPDDRAGRHQRGAALGRGRVVDPGLTRADLDPPRDGVSGAWHRHRHAQRERQAAAGRTTWRARAAG